jgi:cell division protein FtsN
MYGNRDAVRQAAKDVPRKTEEEKSAEAEAQAQAQAQAEEEKKAEPKPKIAKLDSKPPVVDKSTPEKTDAAKILNGETTNEKFTYFLQAGAFLEQDDAENAKAKLALIGVAASIAERKSDNGILYRVRVGPFGQLETMNRVRSRLTDNGVDVAVIRVPK